MTKINCTKHYFHWGLGSNNLWKPGGRAHQGPNSDVADLQTFLWQQFIFWQLHRDTYTILKYTIMLFPNHSICVMQGIVWMYQTSCTVWTILSNEQGIKIWSGLHVIFSPTDFIPTKPKPFTSDDFVPEDITFTLFCLDKVIVWLISRRNLDYCIITIGKSQAAPSHGTISTVTCQLFDFVKSWWD